MYPSTRARISTVSRAFVVPVYSVYRGRALGVTSITLTVGGGALGGPGLVWERATGSLLKQSSTSRLKANTHRDTVSLLDTLRPILGVLSSSGTHIVCPPVVRGRYIYI